MNKTVILKVLSSLPELAAECLALLGEGARDTDEGDLYWFSLNSTNISNGYIRIPVADHIAIALQWMLDTGITSEHAEIIRVEHAGQDYVKGQVVSTRPDGTIETMEGYVLEPFITGYTDAQTMEDGSMIPSSPIFLGRMSE